ncbi:MAG: reactive intermediate/imine deaminase [Lentisphaerae bacterium GWF2_52_8]|nr:MAG: reactive intermediate/imine deaminase [Lentisphaerae bacterium GWF2_52_8]
MAEIRELSTASAPAAVGPYSQAIVAGGFVFASGQLGLRPDTGAFAGDSAAAQAEQALKNLSAVLEAAGSGLPLAVKMTIFLADMADFSSVNEVYQRFLMKPFPARSCVQVAALPKGGRVEIEAIAILK